MNKQPKQLGKGMAALFGENTLGNKPKKNETSFEEQSPFLVSISSIVRNPEQPRKTFNETELLELADSIKEIGVIQPLTVQKEGSKFSLIAGERRLRASKLAGLSHVPVIVKKVTQKDSQVMAIVENVQRKDLNCVEEALAYYKLMSEFNLTQEEVAKKIGKTRSTIANFLRILKLPKSVVIMMQKEILSFGHGKVLASLGNDEKAKRFANDTVANEYSVRELEKLIKSSKKSKTSKEPDNKFFDAKLDKIKSKLETKTGFQFQMKSGKNGSGSVTIKFNNEAEFNDIYNYFIN